MSERRPGFLLLIEKMRVRESIRADCPSPSMKSPSRISRRSFLHTAAAASVGAGVFGFPAILRSASPGGKLNIAIPPPSVPPFDIEKRRRLVGVLDVG